MKSLPFKHTVKLKRKQQVRATKLIVLTMGITPIVVTQLIQYSLNTLPVLELTLPKVFSNFSICLLTLCLFIFYYLNGFSPFENRKIKNTLMKVIEVNGFYLENPETKRIIHSMVIKFNRLNDELYIEVYPEGGKYSSKMNELTAIFQTALNLTVISVQNDHPNHTTYILKDNVSNVIEINNWS